MALTTMKVERAFRIALPAATIAAYLANPANTTPARYAAPLGDGDGSTTVYGPIPAGYNMLVFNVGDQINDASTIALIQAAVAQTATYPQPQLPLYSGF